MQVSLYVHAWQAVLMFLAGVVSVLASFVGYLRSGGGEELLQQALASFRPGSHATFSSLSFDIPGSKLIVLGLQQNDILDGKNQVKGLRIERCEVLLDLWPWPPRVEAAHVYGMRNLELAVQPGFLQDPRQKLPRVPAFPLFFHEINLGLKIGAGPRLMLENCEGLLKGWTRTRPAAAGEEDPAELTGEFSFAKLNGKPFRLTLASLGGNRWEVTGADLAIDTQLLRVSPADLDPGAELLDPVSLLLRALLTGECGAEGALPSLRVAVQPAMGEREFACEGEVAYRDLKWKLPAAHGPAAVAVPSFLNWMFFGERNLWPQWLMPDAIRTGPNGRLTFHMYGSRLDFFCDQGAGSAFIASQGGHDFPRLESVAGSIETDAERRPRSLILRGSAGEDWNGELRMRRADDGRRTFELMVDPRAAGEGPDRLFGVPLWRFRSRVEDASQTASAQAGGVWAKFDVEVISQDFPVSPLLPPGVRDVSGRLLLRGQFTKDRTLALDEIRWTHGALSFGGAEASDPHPLLLGVYGPVFTALARMWGGPASAWRLQDVSLSGQAVARFDAGNRWLGTELKGWNLESGEVLYRNLTTDLHGQGIEIQGYVRPAGAAPAEPTLSLEAGVRERKTGKFKWSMKLVGRLPEEGDGELRFEEREVPWKLHPERESLDGRFIHGLFDKTVTRTMIIRSTGGQLSLEVVP